MNNNWQEQSDEDLVALALANQDVFVVLIKRYEDKLMRYIRRLTNIPYEDAEDVLQEVFIKVYQNLNAFDSKLKFSSWVYRITHNQVISEYRKRKVRPEISWDIDDDFMNRISDDFDIKKDIDHELLKIQLKSVLVKLDKKYSQVLVLKYLEEKTYQEISDILQKPQGTVATLINRAKKQFKKEVAKQDLKL